MGWHDLTFTASHVLTASDMNRLQGNFAALAGQAAGAPRPGLWSADSGFATTGAGSFGSASVSSRYEVNPAGGGDTDLLAVGVTGAPRLTWDASAEAFRASHALDLDAGLGPRTWPRFRAHKNGTSQSGVGTGATRITWAAEDFDEGNAFDLANDRFVAPAAGVYFFTVLLQWTAGLLADEQVITSLYRNGSADAFTIDYIVAGTDQSQALTALMRLAAGDTVEVYARNVDDAANLRGDIERTFFAGSRIA